MKKVSTIAVLSGIFVCSQASLALSDISQNVSWEALEAEKARSNLLLSKDVFPEYFDKTSYEKSEFDLQMYLNAVVAESNISGPDSAATFGYLLDFADFLYRRKSARFATTVNFISNRVQLLSVNEQSKLLPKIFWFLLNLCHEEEELDALPLVKTAIELSLKPGISVDMKTEQSLFAIQRNYTESRSSVTPDGRREHYVLLLVQTASILFDKLQPLSKDAVVAHERLAFLYEEQSRHELAAKEYYKVEQLNNRKAVGDLESSEILLRLMKIEVTAHQCGKAANLYFKHRNLFTTVQSAEKMSEIVELLLQSEDYGRAINVATAIFPHLDWNPNKFIPSKAQIWPGCGFSLPYKQWPTTQLRQWLGVCISQQRMDMARLLYNKCALAATDFNKAGTTEYSQLRSLANELNLFP